MKTFHLVISTAQRLDEDTLRQAPGLAKLLQRGQSLPQPEGLCASICQALGVTRQTDWPVAALTAHAEGLDTRQGYWLRLDPIYMDVGMRGMFARSVTLTEAEQQDFNHTLSSELQPLFAEMEAQQGIRPGFQLVTAKHGVYAVLNAAPDLCTTPIDQIAGRQPTAFLPTGGDARAWSKLINEMQMALHEHPWNAARMTQGKLPVNSVWPWGGGMASQPQPLLDALSGTSMWMADLALAMGLTPQQPPQHFSAMPRSTHALVVLDTNTLTLSELEFAWITPLFKALRRGKVGAASLTVLNDEARAVTLTPWRSWQFWRDAS